MIEKMIVDGGHRLQGEVTISGAKNAALPILVASLLTDEPCVIKGVPFLTDVRTTIEIIKHLGARVEHQADGTVVSQVVDRQEVTAPYNLVRQMRASVCVLGPLLARRGQAKVSLPGGCVIGIRPIDIHLKGLQALGAHIETAHGYVHAQARELRGNEIFLGGPFGSTVLGTANVMMAATLANGTTIIENAACEPEIQDLAAFLNKMGAKIDGAGSHRMIIDGVKELHGTEHTIIPDRIEAGTFMAAAAITSGDLILNNVRMDHLAAVIDKLKEIGIPVRRLRRDGEGRDQVRVTGGKNWRACQLTTLPYPGFPTDLQAQFAATLALADGISLIVEKIYPDRFMHVAELNRMGAHMHKQGPMVVVQGVEMLSGAPVMASDLRASAALVLAGLVAREQTIIDRIYHLDRGYERLDEKLQKLGAKITRS